MRRHAALATLLACLASGGLACDVEHYDFVPDPRDDGADVPRTCSFDEDGGDAASGCGTGLVCCRDDGDGICVNLASDPRNCGDCGQPCGLAEECVASACVCQHGFAECGGECVSLADDPEHCGRCDVRCDSGQECVGGFCQP